MKPEQARALVAETFPKAFDKVRFHHFVKELLNGFNEDKSAPMAVPEAFASHVRSCARLGTYESPDGELADVLIVRTTEPWKLERTRTALRDFVAHKLKRGDSYKEAGLAAFVAPDARSWRFSFVRMEYESKRDSKTGKIAAEERLTPARRFSYIVGEGESCHTAQTRFLDLLQDTETNPALADIEDAFSVEAVTKEFFTKYAELFSNINTALEKLVAKDKIARDEFKTKNVNTVDFAKKLMGQIVFLYFLQKKGWLGVARGQDWGTGPRDFLRRLVKGEHGQHDNFFNDILEPLFYDTLATDRGHEAWCNQFKCRIPFLNGGLFEPLGDYHWRKTDILLPNRLFTNTELEEGITGTGVLDVFDRYNFTVNEAEPLEKDVAIDPEMLGKVFENLIEENRRKGLGAYYTPREIVHYMCQESLINYLDTALNTAKGSLIPSKPKQIKLFDTPEPEQMTLETTVRHDIVPRADIETFVHLGEQISHYEAVDAKYPIKMPKCIEQYARLIDNKLKEITICDPAVGSGAFPVGMMTEIVRARSALTPYFNDIHERTPYHFKRHAIQECLYGVDIDASAVEIAKLRLWLSLVVDEEDVQQIKPLPNLDYKIVVGNSLLGVEKTLFNQEQFERLEELKPKLFNESDRKKKAQFKQQIEDLIHELTNGREAFDFEIYFSEVFHHKKGFDALVGNPPYSSKQSIENKQYRAFFKCVEYKCDPYAFFIELSLRLARQNGSVVFIVPVTWMTNVYYEKLRRLLIDSKSLQGANLIEGLAFETANVDTSLLFLCKDGVGDETYNWAITDPKVSSLKLTRRTYASVRKESRFDIVPKTNVAWDSIRSKVETDSIKLGSFTKISLGMKLAGNDRFVVPVRDKQHPDPIVFGSDLSLFGEIVPMRFFSFATAEIIGGTKKPVIHRTKNKILVQAIRNLSLQRRIVATLDSKGFCFVGTVNSIIPQESGWNVHYLLGLINSTLLNAYFSHRFTTISLTSAFLGELPIKIQKTNAKLSEKISRMVDRILSAKQRDAGADVSALERELDELVYALYDLTQEEIAIIEKSLQRKDALEDSQ